MYIWRKRATRDWIRKQSAQLFRRFGPALAVVERPGKMQVLVDVSCANQKEAVALQHEFGGTIEKLRADWLEQFVKRSRVKPLRIGTRQIVIPAEAAFGTGEHATTAMCLRMLERITQNRDDGWTMLDAGTGSGILAIAGSCLGAKRVVAIDNDPLACSIALRNARANRASNIEFQTGDVLKLKVGGKFDVITANLFSEILMAALPIWSRHLASDGCLILSGILRSQEQMLVAALRRNHFTAREIKRRGKWIALWGVRSRKRI
ncbi:MAG TPA: 50S ribosomal protein L11 methyltransferase [Chthoniobacterales bacterium]|nr:50S ribosomal protein L11 methyltransferase [Chthoniobacterales bacterium]